MNNILISAFAVLGICSTVCRILEIWLKIETGFVEWALERRKEKFETCGYNNLPKFRNPPPPPPEHPPLRDTTSYI